MQILFNVGLRAELRSSQVSHLLVQSVLEEGGLRNRCAVPRLAALAHQGSC